MHKSALLPKVVPWENWNAWRYVFDSLYSPSRDQRQEAIKRVASWDSRGQVPLSVAVTADLVEICIVDNQDSPKSPESLSTGRSDNELSMLYSMALIRMINGLVAPFHGTYAVSIATVAQTLNIPSELVDLRHQSSHHSKLASLPHLRYCAALALEWLKTNYWEAQNLSLSQVQHSFEQKLHTYKKLVKKEIEQHKQDQKQQQGPKGKTPDQKTSSEKHNHTNSVESRKVLSEILSIVSPSDVHLILVPLLLDPKDMLIPNKKKLEIIALATSEKTAQSKKRKAQYFSKLKKVWKIPLKEFSTTWPHFLHMLTIHIVIRIIDAKKVFADSLHQKQLHKLYCFMLTRWYSYILKHFASNTTTTSSSSNTSSSSSNTSNSSVSKTGTSFNYKKHNFMIPYEAIALLGCKNTNKWTAKILRKTLPFLEDSTPDTRARVNSVLEYFDKIQTVLRFERGLSPKIKTGNNVTNSDESPNNAKNNQQQSSKKGKKRKRNDSSSSELSVTINVQSRGDDELDLIEIEKIVYGKNFGEELFKPPVENPSKRRKTENLITTTDTSTTNNPPTKSVWKKEKPFSRAVIDGIGLVNGKCPDLQLPRSLDSYSEGTFLIAVDASTQPDNNSSNITQRNSPEEEAETVELGILPQAIEILFAFDAKNNS